MLGCLYPNTTWLLSQCSCCKFLRAIEGFLQTYMPLGMAVIDLIIEQTCQMIAPRQHRTVSIMAGSTKATILALLASSLLIGQQVQALKVVSQFLKPDEVEVYKDISKEESQIFLSKDLLQRLRGGNQQDATIVRKVQTRTLLTETSVAHQDHYHDTGKLVDDNEVAFIFLH